MWACENGHFEIVELLLHHKADVNWRANVCLLSFKGHYTNVILYYRMSGQRFMLLAQRIV